MPKSIIHAFLVDWQRIHLNIADLKEILSPYVNKLTVLDNPEHYFSEQWNEMLRQRTGDAVLWVMGDVTLPSRFWEVYPELKRMISRPDVGVCGPNVEYTFHKWETKTFPRVEEKVYEVPCAEPNCWLIKTVVLDALHPIDVEKNKYGWGVDLMVSSQAELLGLKTVRDYRFTAGHPIFTGYDERTAENQMHIWEKSLSTELKEVMKRRWAEGLNFNVNWKKRNETKSI